MEEQFVQEKKELTTLSIRDLFYKYIRFLPLFVISVALSLLVAYIYLRYATLIYSSTGTLVIQDDKNGSNSNDKLNDLIQTDNRKNIQNEIEYIQSRKMMARVVNALDLNFTYLAKGNVKELNVYKSCAFKVEAFKITDSAGFSLTIDFQNPNSFSVNGEGHFSFGQIFQNKFGVFRLIRADTAANINDKGYIVNWQPTTAVASSLSSSIVVAPKQNTGIIVLSLETPNPQLSADVINNVMAEYQQATIDDKNAETQKKLVFVDNRIDSISRQLDSITNIEQQFIKANNLPAPTAQSTNYLARIEETSKDILQQQQLLRNAYQIEGDLLNKNATIKVPSTLGLSDPTLNKMADAYNQAQIEKKALLENAPPGNIAVQQQQQIIDQLQKNILKSVENIKQSLSSGIGSLQSFSNTAKSQLSLMPEKQQQLTEIERQLQGKLDIYKTLLEERERSAIALASTISNINVLQDALPNYSPVKPNSRTTKILAILIGLVLPALFIFVLEMLNDKVTTRYDIEKLTDTTIIGEVGHSHSKETLVVTNNNRSVVAEQFRIIRSNLQYVLNRVQKPVVLVTSSFSGEGKSFISTNIGAVLSLAGRKTIILEFDIRKPKILTQLNIGKKPGLTNYLLGKVPLESLPVSVPSNENLFVLPCGPVPPNPAELLLDSKLEELFAWLRENFDVVIMDTAPVGMVSDAMTLSRFADATLYIVRQGHTFKKQIGLIDEFHREGKLPRMSIILNDVKLRTGYGYYGYGRYGYGYGYGSGYFEDETPTNGLTKWLGWLDTKKWKKKKGGRRKVEG